MATKGLLAFLSSVMVAGSLVLQAQDAPSPAAPPSASATSARTVRDARTPELKASVNLVNVYFSVYDNSGYITNLQKGTCAIEEDKVAQKIKSITFENSLPLTIGLLLDTSVSQRHVLTSEQDAATSFFKRLMGPRDEAFLIFSTRM